MNRLIATFLALVAVVIAATIWLRSPSDPSSSAGEDDGRPSPVEETDDDEPLDEEAGPLPDPDLVESSRTAEGSEGRSTSTSSIIGGRPTSSGRSRSKA